MVIVEVSGGSHSGSVRPAQASLVLGENTEILGIGINTMTWIAQ